MPSDDLPGPWVRLAGLISPAVLNAPKTCGDHHNRGEWPQVEEQVVAFLVRNVVGKPWADHLTLAVAVMTARRRQVNTVLGHVLKRLAPRFEDLFSALEITTMDEWEPTEAFRKYLRCEILPNHSKDMRAKCWETYSSAANQVHRWLRSLPVMEQEIYRPYALPMADRGALVEVKKLSAESKQQAKYDRKTATDAVVPSLPVIRAKAQLRLNRILRMRQAFHDAVQRLPGGSPHALPFAYSYDEGEDRENGTPPQERLHFRIWDRRSFVLSNVDHYSTKSIDAARKGTGAYSEEQNRLFLELVRVERLVGDGPAEGLWFADLLKHGVLGSGPRNGPEAEIRARQDYLRAWGHGDEDNSDELIAPFFARTGGLLAWPKEDASFLSPAQRAAEGVLIPVEALRAGAMFGLLAVDIFTTTGMRINEAMQIRWTPDCAKKVTHPAPPEAKDQTPRERVALMLIPKGEREDKPHPYYVGVEQIRLIGKTLDMLWSHYGLKRGDSLPPVPFDSRNERAHRFREPKPYLFQYNGRHLPDDDITACMKFILHGMTFKTREGQSIVVTAHLLRHAFATHAVQVLKIPKDVVREWLQQKDIEVTDYYSQPTDSMIAEHHDQLLMRMTAHVHLGKVVLRAPEEQVQLYEEARGKAGTLAEVEGGHCVSHGYCAAKFACVGCAGKVVDPTKRYQVERKKQWALLQLDICRTDGLMPEVARLEQLVRDCDAELHEMDLIEQYRRDGNRVAFIRAESLELPD